MAPISAKTAATASTTNAKTGSSSVPWRFVMRGPALFGAAIASLLYPYILEHCTATLLVHLGIATLGILCFCHDLWTFSERGVRLGANMLLDRFVLDDLLRALYDPETGLVSCLVASFVGVSTMYGLKMNSSQRTELVQASLSLNNKEEAHTVLMEPGGCRALLPETVKEWLNPWESRSHIQEEEHRHSGEFRLKSCRHPEMETAGIAIGAIDHGSEMSSSECDVSDILEHEEDDVSLDPPTLEEKVRDARGLSFGRDVDTDCEHQQESQRNDREQGHPKLLQRESDPMTVFLRILKDLVREQIRSHIEAMPQSFIENMGVASIVALSLQILLRQNSKRPRLLGTLSALTFSSIATLSLGAIVSRQAFLGKIHDKETLQLACKEIASRVWDKLKQKVRTPKVRTSLAMFVLFIIGRRKFNPNRGLREASRP